MLKFRLPAVVAPLPKRTNNGVFNVLRFTLFIALVILPFVAYGQGSMQRLVRISGDNGNIVSLSAGNPAATYTLTLPPNLNPSMTAASLLFGTGSGLLDWTPAAVTDSGYVIQLVDVGSGQLKPRWVATSTLTTVGNFWSLSGNAILAAWNGSTGSFVGTTNTTPLILATTNTTTAQPIEFYTNNTERMRIAPTGELGIGVTPASGLLLHVGGTAGTSNVRFNSLSGANLPLVFGANEGLLIADANGNLTKRDPGILLQNFVQYDISSPQGQSVTRSNYLFNVSYNATADDAHATGASITSVGGATNRNATGLTLAATATGVGTATGLAIAATGGAINNAVDATGNIRLLSAGGTASRLSLQNPAGTFATTLSAGAQTANINYTLPIVAPAVDGYILAATTAGTMTWLDPASLTGGNYWTLTGNATATAWDGTTGSFLGTTTTQPLVLGTQGAQPIRFYSNNTEKMSLLSSGELGIGTTPTAARLLHVAGTAGTANIRFNSLGGSVLPMTVSTNDGILFADANGDITKRDPDILTRNYVQYEIGTPQAQAVTRTDYLYNVAYSGSANDANAAGAVITSTGGATNRSATGLTLAATATGVGTATGLAVAATGGAINNAVDATGNIRLLSTGGTASRLSLQNPAGTFATTLSAGAQTANINYTLPVAAPAVDGYILAATTAGTMTWLDPSTLTGNYWTLTGNATATAWNGTTGNFLGTTTTQPLVLGTQGAQPIRFYSNNTEKMSLLSSGELGIGTTPTAARLLHVAGTAGTANIRFNSLSGSVLPMTVSTNDGILFADANGDITKRDPDILTRNYVQYEIGTPQAQALTRTDYLYNVAYSGSATDANAAGAVITSTGGATNRSASGLQVTSTATGTGTATGLTVAATGGAINNAVDATGAVRLLAAGGVASPVEFQNPAGTATTTIRAGAQTAAITYTLPTVQAPSAGRILTNDGAGNLSWADLTSTTVDYARNQFDDFVMSTLDQSGSGAADHTEFSYTFENAQVEGDATANDYIGRMYLTTTGTGSTEDAWVSTFGGDDKVMLGGKVFIYETRARIETLSTSSQRLVFYTGLMNSNTIGEPSNGVYFKYSDNLNSGQWQCISRSASTSTTVNTSISVVADQWYILRCVVSPGSPNLVEYYIDNVLVGTSTTNIPSAAVRYVVKMEKTIGSSDRTASTDWLLTKMIR